MLPPLARPTPRYGQGQRTTSERLRIERPSPGNTVADLEGLRGMAGSESEIRFLEPLGHPSKPLRRRDGVPSPTPGPSSVAERARSRHPAALSPAACGAAYPWRRRAAARPNRPRLSDRDGRPGRPARISIRPGPGRGANENGRGFPRPLSVVTADPLSGEAAGCPAAPCWRARGPRCRSTGGSTGPGSWRLPR